jgi:hypothetical protein
MDILVRFFLVAHRRSPAMRLAVLGVLFLAAVVADREFPPVAELPSRPDLPDPLVMFNGERVTTKEQWYERRRPELKALFEYYMYGAAPPLTGSFSLRPDGRPAFGGKATLWEVSLGFSVRSFDARQPHISLLLIVPNHRKAPAPVFVGMNFCGNHALLNDPDIRIPTAWMYGHLPGVKDNRATEAGRGSQTDVWALEQSIDRGYAIATFYNGDVDPDRADVRQGIQADFEKAGLAKPGPHAWGTIAAWAWGISRVVDFLQGVREIDKTRIAAVGHSRLGKTALLAAALDDRIALAIPHQAGCGGTAPSRGKVGESVKQINTSFPHWFCGTFKEFNDCPDRLPFDQNCLAALVAPRPLLFTNAVEDTWANPDGQFHVLQAADPVYRLLGAGGLGAKEMPPPGQLLDSRLGYYIRPGKHSMTKEDWQIFLDYADRHLGRPAK